LIGLAILPHAALFGHSTACARTLKEYLPDYEVTLPDEFVEVPRLRAANPSVSHYLVKGQPAVGEPLYALAIRKLGGVIGREPLEKKHLPPELANATITSATWQGFEVTVVESLQQQPGVNVLTLSAQIPLKREAIQVMLAGDPSREAEYAPTCRWF
jgi:hypothetical protein